MLKLTMTYDVQLVWGDTGGEMENDLPTDEKVLKEEAMRVHHILHEPEWEKSVDAQKECLLMRPMDDFLHQLRYDLPRLAKLMVKCEARRE